MSAETKSSFPAKRILLAVDGSENSFRAANVAIDIAKDRGSELIVLNVIVPVISVSPPVGAGSYPIDYGSYYDNEEKNGSELVDRVTKLARNNNVARVKSFVQRSPSSIVETIVEVAENENADLIVIGTRGLGGFKRLVLGSVSGGVVAHAHCNVLIVR
jgi:nucleotide-binding universal stress UspA family protein